MVSTADHHPGSEKDPDELDTHHPGLNSLKPGKWEVGESLPLTPSLNIAFPLIFPSAISFRPFHFRFVSTTNQHDGFSGQTMPEMKREHGEAYPKGTETVAAPATVSGERRLMMPLIARSGRQGAAKTREPGDLPSQFEFEPDGVRRERCDDLTALAAPECFELASGSSSAFSALLLRVGQL